MKTIVENLTSAIAHVEAFPEDRLDLSNWSQEAECGTLFCGAGLLATKPEFIEQLHVDWDSAPVDVVASILSDQGQMFGDDPYGRLFASCGSGTWDDELQPFHSDKELLLKRLAKQLTIYEKEANDHR